MPPYNLFTIKESLSLFLTFQCHTKLVISLCKVVRFQPGLTSIFGSLSSFGQGQDYITILIYA